MFQSAGREFRPAVTDFWQAKRVPLSPLYPRVTFAQWLHTDSEENYQRRGNRAFSRESVDYRFNALGYRGPEFERDASDGSVLFVGDSNTFGLGTPYDRLWTSLVTRSLTASQHRPVRQFNVGFGATGSDYVAMMVHQCMEALRPDAICVLWPSIARRTWFPTASRQVFFLPEWQPDLDTEEHGAFLRLATEAQRFFEFVRNFQLVRARLAEGRIPFYWGLLEPMPTDVIEPYLGLDGYVGAWACVDLARDGRHGGIDSHAAFAAAMLEAMAGDGFAAGGDGPAAPPLLSLAPTSFSPRSPDRIDALLRPINRVIGAGRLRRRIRSMKRRDPFIY
jgi:hypothetical protein